MKNEILTDEMLREIFAKLEKGETFNYEDGDTQIHIAPNGIMIQYKTSTTNTQQEKEVEQFLMLCEDMDDELFIEVCESFEKGELAGLQEALDTPKYRDAIKCFVDRAQEIANSRLAEITNAADAEIRRNERVIAEAQKNIEIIHRDLDIAHDKYTF